MRHILIAALSFSVSAAALPFIANAAAPPDALLARIDAAAKSFKGMTADISSTQHTAVVDDDDVQMGTIRLLRVDAGLTRALVDLKGDSGSQTIALNGHEVRTYNRKTNIVDVIDLANKQGLVNQFLLLGFGATSSQLKSTYDVSYAGDEKIGGQQTSHLSLVPKSADTKRTLKQADLWFAADGLVAQQKFLFAAGDYKLVTYSHMKPGALSPKELDLNVPKDAVIQKEHR